LPLRGEAPRNLQLDAVDGALAGEDRLADLIHLPRVGLGVAEERGAHLQAFAQVPRAADLVPDVLLGREVLVGRVEVRARLPVDAELAGRVVRVADRRVVRLGGARLPDE